MLLKSRLSPDSTTRRVLLPMLQFKSHTMLRFSCQIPASPISPQRFSSSLSLRPPSLKFSPQPPVNPILNSSSFVSLNPSSSSSSSLSTPFTSLTSPHSRSMLSMAGRGASILKPRASSSASNSGGGAGREILVHHLLVKEDDLKLVSELQQKIVRGADLSDLAVEYSICPSKEQGGMLGWVRKGQMVPEFEEAAFNAPLNKVVKCKTKFGWHLLQVLSEREETLLQEIAPEELHVKMQDPSFLEEVQLIDVREPEEVAQASLPGFQVLPLRQFGSWSAEITIKFDPQKDTYVLCHHGVRSLQVAKWLLTQGFKRVTNVTGGIHAYAEKADPSVPTY